MTLYNGYTLNYSIEELNKMLSEETTDVVLISKENPNYQNLPDGDKKALEHLVKAANILNNVSLIQDNALNIAQKNALTEASNNNDEHATLALKMFN